MKITRICQGGAGVKHTFKVKLSEYVKLYRSKLAASLLKVYSFTVLKIFSEKNRIAAKNPCEEGGSEIWTLYFESFKHE
eukprot:snap_masked-scaffold_61-processed-gene-0.44-mRNA-1 protein AED:1.00 eAED:1.00 QI:0/-1/0/0/-1/1/1/0/78